MFELDEQISLRGRITTIRGELDRANQANMILHQYSDASNGDKYEVCFSDRPGNMSDTRAWEVSKADFDYLREQGIPNAFGRS